MMKSVFYRRMPSLLLRIAQPEFHSPPLAQLILSKSPRFSYFYFSLR
jgi:hypothetical protein